MIGNEKCSHCGKRIGFGEFRYPNVHVSVKSQGLDYQFRAETMCSDCFEKLNDRIGRMIREVQHADE